MKLQLADKPSFKDKVKRLGLALVSTPWRNAKFAWSTFWSNMPAAEKARQADNMFVVKQDLNNLAARNLFAQMNFENADFLIEKLPLVIEDTNKKFAQTPAGNLGQKRVLARYLKSQNQILEEIYAWSTANLPPDPGTTKLPDPIAKDPKLKTQPGERETFPDADKSTDEVTKKWYEQPAYLVGAAVVAVLVLPKLLKR
jgi:hypothetical protein